MPMDFVLALHSHLPWVLNHGRWPHGSDWLTEGALETYLPLLERLRGLQADGVAAPVTIGFTPVLASQLISATFQAEMEMYLEQRRIASDDMANSPSSTGDGRLQPVVQFWRERFEQMRTLWRAIDGDIIGAFRALENAGRIEIMGSAATHGFLPLLARDESIRLQLAVGAREHERLFGRAPRGCWLPECAYRPRGPWTPWPGGPRSALRRGIDEHVADAGFRYFFVDAHLVTGGEPLGLASDGWLADTAESLPAPDVDGTRSPYRAYGVMSAGRARVSAFVRDPRSSRQVWSRHGGYPGDGAYLEFHKQHWPGGLRLWRVSAPGTDLGQKEPYDPATAEQRAKDHAAHFAGLLGEIAGDLTRRRHPVLAVPFDTELFGHWWFEGPEFLADTYRALAQHPKVEPSTAEQHLERYPSRSGIRLPQGSWGANGDFSMWLSDHVAWTWQRLWPLEEAFWDAAPAALADPAWHPVLEQAGRELLLAQSSDWQFIMSTGMVADYGERRFRGHCELAERLVRALTDMNPEALEAARTDAAQAKRRDDLFPNILPAIRAALDGTRALS